MKLEQAARQIIVDWDSGIHLYEAITAMREALAEQAEHEPVARVIGGVFEPCNDAVLSGAWELYASSVRTKDLTDDEIYPLYNEPTSDKEAIEFARAVIAADREKNK